MKEKRLNEGRGCFTHIQYSSNHADVEYRAWNYDWEPYFTEAASIAP